MTEPQRFLDGRVVLHAGDCRDVLRGLADASIDSVVTDPPYALVSIVKRFGKDGAAPARGDVYARAAAGFMGKQWDTGETAFAVEFWQEVLRVLRPGGHVVAFGGSRTYGHLQVAIEAAGFEVRDGLLDLIAQDDPVIRFCSSLSEEQLRAFVRCFEDSQFGGLLAWIYGSGFPKNHDVSKAIDKRLGAEREKVAKAGAPAWQRGIGNVRPWMLDPDHKVDSDQPATEEAARWLGWGTALRPAMEPAVLARKPLSGTVAETVLDHGTGALNIDGSLIGEATRSRSTGDLIGGNTSMAGGNYARRPAGTVVGNWPANVMHDGSPAVVDAFPPDGEGSRARFFYGAKADSDDRVGSKHPTVKPVDLMRWLVKLVTPPGGTVLDPFAGTGGTGEAAWREGFNAVLIEREADYRDDIARRMALALAGPALRRAGSAKARGDGADAGPLFGGSSVAGGGGAGSTDTLPTRTPGRGRTIGPIGLRR